MEIQEKLVGAFLNLFDSVVSAVPKILVGILLVAGAFLVAPLVGAFFIDFINALIITGFLNFWPH